MPLLGEPTVTPDWDPEEHFKASCTYARPPGRFRKLGQGIRHGLKAPTEVARKAFSDGLAERTMSSFALEEPLSSELVASYGVSMTGAGASGLLHP